MQETSESSPHTNESPWNGKLSNPVLVFGFDGVLAIPYTNPEENYEQVPEILKVLSERYIICVASFNQRASVAFSYFSKIEQRWIDAMRAGANHGWDVDCLDEYNNTGGDELSKVSMIQSMLMELGLQEDHFVEFFDDDPKNCDEVNKISNFTAWEVDNKIGLSWDYVKHLLQ